MQIAVGLWVAIVATIGIGWIMNIMALVGMNWQNPIGIEGFLRIVGIVIAPLGAIMGYLV